MLSSITPIGERGRGHRFGATAAWFVAGATIGGACLGAAAMALAAVISATGLPSTASVAIGAACALAAAAADAGMLRRWGITIPVMRRQVNERWLDQFRNGVYGAGFGWQIGVGVATYIMTAGVFLTVALGALSGRPVIALLAGVVFGFVRGLAVYVGAGATTPAALARIHRRLYRWEAPVRWAVVGTQAAAAAALAGAAWWPAAGAILLLAGAGAVVCWRRATVTTATSM